jgi:hypothetical protein
LTLDPAPMAVAVRVAVERSPTAIESADLFPKLSEKSGGLTVSVNVALWVTLPTVPVTVIVYGPGTVLDVVAIVNVAAAGVVRVGETGLGAIEHVVAAGQPVIV